MKVRDIMAKNVVCISHKASLKDAHELMLESWRRLLKLSWFWKSGAGYSKFRGRCESENRTSICKLLYINDFIYYFLLYR